MKMHLIIILVPIARINILYCYQEYIITVTVCVISVPESEDNVT